PLASPVIVHVPALLLETETNPAPRMLVATFGLLAKLVRESVPNCRAFVPPESPENTGVHQPRFPEPSFVITVPSGPWSFGRTSEYPPSKFGAVICTNSLGSEFASLKLKRYVYI